MGVVSQESEAGHRSARVVTGAYLAWHSLSTVSDAVGPGTNGV